jgi:hypothetical protein
MVLAETKYRPPWMTMDGRPAKPHHIATSMGPATAPAKAEIPVYVLLSTWNRISSASTNTIAAHREDTTHNPRTIRRRAYDAFTGLGAPGEPSRRRVRRARRVNRRNARVRSAIRSAVSRPRPTIGRSYARTTPCSWPSAVTSGLCPVRARSCGKPQGTAMTSRHRTRRQRCGSAYSRPGPLCVTLRGLLTCKNSLGADALRSRVPRIGYALLYGKMA